MREKRTKKVTPAAELEALAALPNDRINVRDIAEVTDWSGAKRGLFYRPVKQQLTLRLDADVVAWFKRRAPRAAATRPTSTARCGNTSSSTKSGPGDRNALSDHCGPAL